MNPNEENDLNSIHDDNSKLSEEQWSEIEQRDTDFISGKEAASSWSDIKEKIRSRKP